MGVVARLLHKVRVEAYISVLVWARILNAVRRGLGNRLLILVDHTDSDLKTEPGLLSSTLELMQERLRDSLEETEQKSRQLDESKKQLARSRDFLQTVIDSLDDQLIVLDNKFRITHANRSMRLKYEGKKVVGRYCYEVTHGLSHPCSPPSHICPVLKVRQTGKPFQVTHRHFSNGEGITEERYDEISASPLFDSRGKIVQVVELIRDVTKSREMQNQILEVNRQLTALNAISSTVNQSLSLDVILNSTLDKVLDLMEAEVGSILLIDEKSQTLSYRVHRGFSEQFVEGIATLSVGEGVTGKVAECGETMVVEDVSRDSRITRPVASEEGLKAFISVPLKSKERIVGVLNINSREPRSFSKEEVQLLTAIGHQLGIAVENAQLYGELGLKEQMRTELLQRIISIQEDERLRVARELHDVTSQALATISVRLEALNTHLRPNTEETETRLEVIKSLIASTSKELHELIYDLRPSLLDDLGLPAALRSYAHRSLDAAGVAVYLEVIGHEKNLPSQVEIALFRIAQEAIANVARHAQAERIYISLELKENSITVQVEDDGVGFDLAQGFSSITPKQSMGLLGIKERTELLGGTWAIDTKPGGGTRVLVEVPVDYEQIDG